MVFYEVGDVVRFHWESEICAVRAQWQTFNTDNETLRSSLMLASGYLRFKSSDTWIVDSMTTTGVLSKSNLTWIVTDLMPHLVACGLRQLVTVQPRSTLTAVTTRHWQKNVLVAGFDVQMTDVASLDEAKDLLRVGLFRKSA